VFRRSYDECKSHTTVEDCDEVKKTKGVEPVGEEESVQEPLRFETIVNDQRCHAFMLGMLEHEVSQSKGHESDPIEPPGFETNECEREGRRAEQKSTSGPDNGGKGS